jgi:rhodanese-related sulfurtransferase
MDQIAFYAAKLAYEIDAADLKNALDAGEHIIVIDARNAVAFASEHIPGAINLPHRQMDAQSTAALDRTATYVSYCDGIGCNASTKGALKLAQLGFNVRELIGGLDWWKRDSYATSQLNTVETIACGCN